MLSPVLDIVNHHCEQLLSGHDLFAAMFLVEPRECKLQPDILTSSRAVLHCGPVRKDDILFFNDMTCARATGFYLISEIYFVEVVELPIVADDIYKRFSNGTISIFKECRFVVDACIWHATEDEGIIKVCVPPVLLHR